jgi:hypothetical protein
VILYLKIELCRGRGGITNLQEVIPMSDYEATPYATCDRCGWHGRLEHLEGVRRVVSAASTAGQKTFLERQTLPGRRFIGPGVNMKSARCKLWQSKVCGVDVWRI